MIAKNTFLNFLKMVVVHNKQSSATDVEFLEKLPSEAASTTDLLIFKKLHNRFYQTEIAFHPQLLRFLL